MRKQEREMRLAADPLPNGTTAAAKTSVNETLSASGAVPPTSAANRRELQRSNAVRSAGGVVKWAILMYAFNCPILS